MARLYDGLLVWVGHSLAHFLDLKSVEFAIPFLLDDLDHVAFVLWFERRQLNLYGALFDHGCWFSLRFVEFALLSRAGADLSDRMLRGKREIAFSASAALGDYCGGAHRFFAVKTGP